MRLYLALILTLGTFALKAQKVGYVDSEYILKNVPEYKDAQKQLDNISGEWQQQIDKKYQEIDRLKQEYKVEEILLTSEMKEKRLSTIRLKEKEVREFQKKKFGIDGELFTQRQKLIQPIQEKIYKAMKDVARSSGYIILFDKAGSTTLIYTNPKYNKSDAVLKKLGYEPGKEKD